MLTLLIEGERLKTLAEQGDVEILQTELPQWKVSVETFMHSSSQTLSAEERLSVQRLRALTDEIAQILSALSQRLSHELSSLGKQHHGAQKYMRNSGEAF